MFVKKVIQSVGVAVGVGVCGFMFACSAETSANVTLNDDLQTNAGCVVVVEGASCSGGTQSLPTVNISPGMTINVPINIAPVKGTKTSFSLDLDGVPETRRPSGKLSPLAGSIRVGTRINGDDGLVEVEAPKGADIGDTSIITITITVNGKPTGLRIPVVVVPPPQATTSTCDAVTITKVHNSGPLPGHTRLSPITNGTVPCVYHHDEQFPAGVCQFNTTATTKAWVETPQGAFAVANQFTRQDGTPRKTTNIGEDDWVIGSVAHGAAGDLVDCVGVGGADLAGTSTGTELGGSCGVEVFNTVANTTGFQMDNWATRTVCSYGPATATDTGAIATADSATTGAPCLMGQGAGLNDATGRERDSGNTYYSGSTHWCHVASSGGVQVFAGKRPATRNFPAPARVDEFTPVLWRPISPLTIAN